MPPTATGWVSALFPVAVVELLPLLADGGSIVNLSSGLARMPFPQRAAYGSIKGAVEVLTRYMAAELGPRGMTADVVVPGAVVTDFSGGTLRANRPAPGGHRGPDGARPVRRSRRHRPGHRQPLAPGSGWVTGQVMEASGGLHL